MPKQSEEKRICLLGTEKTELAGDRFSYVNSVRLARQLKLESDIEYVVVRHHTTTYAELFPNL